jgi:hypothetical protein
MPPKMTGHNISSSNATAGPSSFPGYFSWSWRTNGIYLSLSTLEFLILHDHEHSVLQFLMTQAPIHCESDHALNPDLSRRFALSFFLNVTIITHLLSSAFSDDTPPCPYPHLCVFYCSTAPQVLHHLSTECQIIPFPCPLILVYCSPPLPLHDFSSSTSI